MGVVGLVIHAYSSEALRTMQARFNAAMDTLAKRLKTARARLELTQTKLAALSGVKQSDVSKIERGAIRKTTAIPTLARALQCDPHWLQTGEGTPGWDDHSNPCI